MEKRKKKLGVLSIILAVLIGLGSVGFLFSFLRNKEESTQRSSGGSSSSTVTKIYSHHFDVVFEDTIGYNGSVTSVVWTFNFNCMSDSSRPYETLGDLEGDGYIVSAFGQCAILYNGTYTPASVYGEVRIVNDGTIFYYYMDLTGTIWSDYGIHYRVVENMGDYEVQDSVTKI